MPEFPAALLDQPAIGLAPISSRPAGLRLGTGLFLASPPELGLAEEWRALAAGFAGRGTLRLDLRSGHGLAGTDVGRIPYPFQKPVDRVGFFERAGGSRALFEPSLSSGLKSLDDLGGARLAPLVPCGNLSGGLATVSFKDLPETLLPADAQVDLPPIVES